MKRILALALLATLGLASPALADKPREHDGGIFVRLSAGIGRTETNYDVPVDFEEPMMEEAAIQGMSGDANLAIGAIVSPGLALHGTIWGSKILDPELSIDGQEEELDDTTFLVHAFGGGVTYYTSRSNVYLSASVGLAQGDLKVGSITFETGTGWAVDLTLGKEWWVGDRWGIGLAGAIDFHDLPEADDDDGIAVDLSGTSFALRFSASFN